MRQALHIFRKDVRALWPQILIALAATALPVLDRDDQHADKLLAILYLARWYFVACAIHQEKLIDDREWWLTRPYSWKALLASKALLIAVFVQVPLLLSDIALLQSNGLPIASAWGRLAARQASFALALIVPAAALAAVTSGLMMFGLAALAMILAIFTPFFYDTDLSKWGPLLWVPPTLGIAILSLASLLLLLWQYRSRRPLPARATLGGATLCLAVLLVIPPGSWGVALATLSPSPPRETDAIHLEWNQTVQASAIAGKPSELSFRLPLHIAGLPEGMLVQPDLVECSIDTSGGLHWSSGWRALFYYPRGGMARWNWEGPRDASLDLGIPATHATLLHKRPATWRITAAFTILGRERLFSASPSNGVYNVPGFAICVPESEAVYGRMLSCRNSKPPSDEVAISETGYQFTRPANWMNLFSLSPSPVWTTTILLPPEWKGPSITFLMRRPVAHIRRELVAQTGPKEHP